MKLQISEKLVNSYNKLEDGAKLTLFQNIETIANKQGVQRTDTSSLLTFLNRMVADLNRELNYQINPFTSPDDIQGIPGLDMYTARVVNDENEILATVVIANAGKLGNTLITQQLPMDYLSNIRNNDAYIVNTRPAKICYLTFDIHSYLDDLKTLRPLLRATQTLGYQIIEMFPTNRIPDQYDNVKDLLNDLRVLKRNGNDPDSGIELVTTPQGNNELIATIDVRGQSSKYYGFYLLAIYVLNHPKLIYDLKPGQTPDLTLATIKNLYNRDVSQSGHENLEELEAGADDSQEDTTPLPTGDGLNKLLYGAPGTGKSYQAAKRYPNFDRVTFYPDYDFTQFIGGLKPTRGTDGSIDYQFVAGPFTNSLITALNDPSNDHGIIIEELNRANVAAVFGEVFQLLDRSSDVDSLGISQYPINDPDLAEYLDQLTNVRYAFQTKGIQLPGNFSIIATMNPADQGVFPVDAAFKRRWEQEYFPINWKADNVISTKLPGFDKPWPVVGSALNDFLLQTLNVEEDALFGPFFFKENDHLDIENVSSKILGYLWNNVARYNREQLFNTGIKTLSQAIDALSNPNKSVFVSGLEEKVRTHAVEPANQNSQNS